MIYFSQTQFLLAKTNEDRTISRKAQILQASFRTKETRSAVGSLFKYRSEMKCSFKLRKITILQSLSNINGQNIILKFKLCIKVAKTLLPKFSVVNRPRSVG